MGFVCLAFSFRIGNCLFHIYLRLVVLDSTICLPIQKCVPIPGHTNPRDNSFPSIWKLVEGWHATQIEPIASPQANELLKLRGNHREVIIFASTWRQPHWEESQLRWRKIDQKCQVSYENDSDLRTFLKLHPLLESSVHWGNEFLFSS